MRRYGIILVALGLIWGIVAFNMPTTVVAGGNTIGSGPFAIDVPKMEVQNIGLLEDRRNYLMISGLLIVVGVLLFGFGSLSRASSGTRKCPYCAELIKQEAVKCRHCNGDVSQSASADVASSQPVLQSYVKPLPAVRGRFLTKQRAAIGVIAILVSIFWIVFFPTTVALDHQICRKRMEMATYQADPNHSVYSKKGEALKNCMLTKRHHLKASAIASTEERIASSAAMVATATINLAQSISRPLSSFDRMDGGRFKSAYEKAQDAIISSARDSLKEAYAVTVMDTDSWE